MVAAPALNRMLGSFAGFAYRSAALAIGWLCIASFSPIAGAATLALSPCILHHPSLTGYWKFDEGSGSIAKDGSRNALHGRLRNMDSAAWVTEQLNDRMQFPNAAALEFDGVDDFVDLGTRLPLLEGARDVTLSAWISVDAVSEYEEEGDIIAISVFNGGRRTQYSRAVFGVLPGLYVFAGGRSFSGDAYQSVKTLTALESGRWYHIAAVFDYPQQQIDIYIDGKKQETAGDIAWLKKHVPYHPSANAAIGSEDDGGNKEDGGDDAYFDGRIDDLRVYESALHSLEIESLSNGECGHAIYSGTKSSAPERVYRRLMQQLRSWQERTYGR